LRTEKQLNVPLGDRIAVNYYSEEALAYEEHVGNELWISFARIEIL
jgi:hypothetical protein